MKDVLMSLNQYLDLDQAQYQFAHIYKWIEEVSSTQN